MPWLSRATDALRMIDVCDPKELKSSICEAPTGVWTEPRRLRPARIEGQHEAAVRCLDSLADEVQTTASRYLALTALRSMT